MRVATLLTPGVHATAVNLSAATYAAMDFKDEWRYGEKGLTAERKVWDIERSSQLAPHAAIRHTILLSLNYVAAMPAKEECQSIAY